MSVAATATELTIAGPAPLRGRIRVPGDKSISHRALLFAAVAEGRCTVGGLPAGDDVLRTRRLIEAVGVRVRSSDDGRLSVTGVGWDGLREPSDVIDVGNSGTTIRIGLGLLAGRSFHAVIVGDKSIARRPMRRVVEPLRAMGAIVNGREDGEYTPIAIRGGALRGVRHDLPVASAQTKSALLMAGLQAQGETVVVSPAPSRDHTERMLRGLGVDVTTEGPTVRTRAGALPSFDLIVPGDPSSAAFWIVGALVTPDSEVTVEGVSLNPTRVHYVEVLRRMGAQIEMVEEGTSCGEPHGYLRASTSDLSGTVIAGDEIPLVLDEIPILAVAAGFAEGVTEIRDAEELAVKESDRIGAVQQELSQTGLAVEARRDGLLIRGGRPAPSRFKAHGDHRVAMAAAVTALGCDGESVVQGWAAVKSSYPEFADHLTRLTVERG